MRAADVNPMNHSQLSCQSTWFLQVHTCSNIRVACRGDTPNRIRRRTVYRSCAQSPQVSALTISYLRRKHAKPALSEVRSEVISTVDNNLSVGNHGYSPRL